MRSLLDVYRDLSYRKKILLFLVIGFGVAIYFQQTNAISALVMLLVIHILHLVFYTEQPRIFWVYCAFSIAIVIILDIWQAFFEFSFPIFLFLTAFETLRVILMAIVRYPMTIQELKDWNEKLEERVEKRTAELEEANAKLRELDQMKTTFVQQASHDLRTPLAAIKGSLDNLSIGVAGELNEKQKKILNRATRSVDRLTDLINDVLDLSRLETGRIKVEKANISFATIVKSAVRENQSAADVRRIAIDFTSTDDSLFIYADAGKMERVAGELINNAIKYTPEEGTITVRLEDQDRYARLSVQDTGIGMSAEDCKKIWSRFYRTYDSQFFAKGSGLGLSIVKELVEMHQGTIQVKSEKGKGTTFTLFLPLVQKPVTQ